MSATGILPYHFVPSVPHALCYRCPFLHDQRAYIASSCPGSAVGAFAWTSSHGFLLAFSSSTLLLAGTNLSSCLPDPLSCTESCVYFHYKTEPGLFLCICCTHRTLPHQLGFLHLTCCLSGLQVFYPLGRPLNVCIWFFDF